jgi:DNA replication licensing factor MCM5
MASRNQTISKKSSGIPITVR